MIRPGKTRGPYVGQSGDAAGTVPVSGNDTTPGTLSEKIVEGQSQQLEIRSPSGDEKLEIIHGVAGFYDDFVGAAQKPFWYGNDAITSGDWQVDLVNNYLDCVAGTGQRVIRYGIEGDYDYAFKITPQSGVSSGIYLNNDAGTIALNIDAGPSGGNIVWFVTGKSNTTVSAPGATYWIRTTRYQNEVAAWYKLNDTDPWTLMNSFTDVDPGYNAQLALDSGIGTTIPVVSLYDNVMSQRVRSNESKQFVPLTDGATINIDATHGNKFSVTLGGNRTIANPTNMIPEQMMILALKQDVTGSRTITWGADFRFSGGTAPTLTTTGGKTDYLGFIYNSSDDKWDCIAQSLNH